MYDRVMIPGILSEADGVIALSMEDSKFLGGFCDMNRITIIPNGLDIEYINQVLLANKQPLIDSFESKKVILFVGRLVPHKGAQYLLKSIKIYSKDIRKNNTILLIVGNGPQQLYLKQFVNENKIDDLVFFTGLITDNKKFEYFQKSHIFVLPSLSEGLPTTILEAMFFGLPVIATDLPVIRQYFSDNLIIIPEKDPERLGKALLLLIQNQKLCQNLSVKAKEKIIHEFTWHKIIQNYLEFYMDRHSKHIY